MSRKDAPAIIFHGGVGPLPGPDTPVLIERPFPPRPFVAQIRFTRARRVRKTFVDMCVCGESTHLAQRCQLACFKKFEPVNRYITAYFGFFSRNKTPMKLYSVERECVHYLELKFLSERAPMTKILHRLWAAVWAAGRVERPITTAFRPSMSNTCRRCSLVISCDVTKLAVRAGRTTSW